MKESVLSLKEKTALNRFSYFKIARKYQNLLWLTCYIFDNFDNFSIWLQGYRIKFSCLYIPQGYYFIWLLYIFFLISSLSPPLR